jgi:hypothetical protein
MINKYTRTPQIEIEVRRPNYSSIGYEDSLIATFGAYKEEGNTSTAAISYAFNESLNSLEGSFNMELTAEVDKNGNTWYDKIHKRDLVFIKEHGLTRFMGFVQNKRYLSRMGERGPQRSIAIDGMSIGALITTFNIILDQHILSSNRTAQSATQQFMSSLAGTVDENQSMAKLMTAIIDSFLTMQEEIGGNQNVGVKHIMENFVYTDFSDSVVSKYPIVLNLYQTGENNLYSILQSLITPPFHEFYGTWNNASGANRYDIHVRPTPFDAEDWKSLPITVIPDDIPALFLRDYNIGETDAEAKTIYGVFLPGSGYSREKSLTLNDFNLHLKRDDTKWPYYGYRPMFIDLKFFNRAEEANFQAADLMREYSDKLYDWYHNNVDFLSGTVSIMNVQNESYPKYPKIGERLGFLGGEFYIEGTNRSWEYGGSLVSSLQVSRGFMYQESGEQLQPISQIGQKVGLLEVSGEV